MDRSDHTELHISNFGQIQDAKVRLGDFTVLVGPQASGKSIFVQLLKLILDSSVIKKNIKGYGFTWDNPGTLLDLYFGEGMKGIWKSSSKILLNQEEITLSSIYSSKSRQLESVFLIPAQRVLTIQQGWPRNFMSYEVLDPFVVKSFSENLRLMMEKGLGSGKGPIFPQEGRMKKVFRDTLEKSIFYNAQVELDKRSVAKQRFILSVGKSQLPYMTWSAGQREFMPLLLGLYWLMPSSKASRKKGIKWVIIEEPEMGLHPKAIESLLLVFLELIHRGYKVIVSTHSTVILEMVWLIRNLQELGEGGGDALFNLFKVPKRGDLHELFTDVLKKRTFHTYYFSPKKVKFKTQDISSLDPSESDKDISDWGGLSSFSTKVSDLLSEAMIKKFTGNNT